MNKRNVVTIKIDKRDDMIEDLCRDLNPKSYGLKQSSIGNELVFHGKVSDLHLGWILDLCAMSPYGSAYTVFSNGRRVY